MSMIEDLVFNEKVEKIAKALNEAVPKGSKSYEVVYALCILLANIFKNSCEEDADKDDYVFALKNIIRDTIDVIENK